MTDDLVTRTSERLAAEARLEGLVDVAYAVTDSPVGPLVLATTEQGLVASSFLTEEAFTERAVRVLGPRVLRAPARLDDARRQLDEFFAGTRRSFDLTIDWRLASPFAQKVLAGLTAVSYGTTTSYGELAARLGRPSASRAVGTALGSNPVCVVVPCHRVLRSGGQLGGYAGGLPAKEFLLGLEGRVSPTVPTATSDAPR